MKLIQPDPSVIALRFFTAALSHYSGRPVRLRTLDGREETFNCMNDFVTKDSGKRVYFLTGARRDVETGKGRFDLLPPEALRRLAGLLERGAAKYGDRNWEKGIPLSRCFSSAIRHLFQALDGDTDEDHLAAVLFNVSCIITFRERIKTGRLPSSLDDVRAAPAPAPDIHECGPVS